MIEIVKTQIGVMTYLAPTGPFEDDGSISLLRRTVDSCLSGHNVNIVLDMSRVQTVTGIFLESLLDIQDSLSKIGGELKVVNANGLVKEIFKISGFYEYVAILDEG